MTPKLDVSIRASFPSAEIFGVKLINGHATQSVLSITNNEASAITFSIAGGSLHTLATPAQQIRNLTAVKYNVQIPAGQNGSFAYPFTTVLPPQQFRLNLVAAVKDSKGTVFTVQAFDETVTVVEPETSLFDPQM